MKNIMFCLFLMIGTSLIAQTHVLYFKDGTTKTGSTKRGNKKLKIRETKKGKFQEVDLSTLDYATSTDKKGNTTTWGYVAVKEGKKPRLLTISYLGENIRLYEFSSSGERSGQVSNTTSASVGFTVTQVYAQRTDESFATMLRSGGVFGKSFETRAAEYFKDCPTLTKQLGTEGFEKGDVEDVAKFYDNSCTE